MRMTESLKQKILNEEISFDEVMDKIYKIKSLIKDLNSFNQMNEEDKKNYLYDLVKLIMEVKSSLLVLNFKYLKDISDVYHRITMIEQKIGYIEFIVSNFTYEYKIDFWDYSILETPKEEFIKNKSKECGCNKWVIGEAVKNIDIGEQK